MPITLQYKDLTIELSDDSAFNQTSDSSAKYNKVVQVDKDKEYSPSSQHAIKVFRDNNLINSGIILASGGGTGVGSDTGLIDDDNLIIRCCNKVFSLALPELNINWVIEVDWATCFSIHQYQDTFISHGELSIARFDKTGKILWSYGGADIFVCHKEGNAFEMFDTYIALTDFNGSKYKIDYDGKTIDHTESDYYSREPITVLMKPRKKWWKFW